MAKKAKKKADKSKPERKYGQNWYDVGEKPELKIVCHGDLTIRAQPVTSLVVVADPGQEINIEGGTDIESHGDLKLIVPLDASVDIAECNGNLKMKGVRGAVTAGYINGDAGFAALDQTLRLHEVNGRLRVRDVGGNVEIETLVNGDIDIRHCGGFSVLEVHGDMTVAHMAGGVSAERIHGDVAAKYIAGDLSLGEVHGDCVIADVAGIMNVNGMDDVRFTGSLGPGKHTINAQSTISVRWPSDAGINLVAKAPSVTSHLTDIIIKEESDSSLVASIGESDCHLTLEAKEKITMRHTHAESASEWDSFADVEFDFSGLGESIEARISATMDKLGPEISMKVEKAVRKAQSAVENLAQEIEKNPNINFDFDVDGFRRRTPPSATRPPTPPHSPSATPPPPPPAPTPEPKDTGKAQLKILEMLEKGTISAEQANELLASLN